MHQDEERKEICPICLDVLSKEISRPDCCMHEFCLPCLENWSRHERFCPVDKLKFKKIITTEKAILLKGVKRKKEPDLYDMSARCEICENEKRGFVLLCDTCNLGYHLKCLTPRLNEVPEGQWHCPPCVAIEENIRSKKINTKEVDAAIFHNSNRKTAPAEIVAVPESYEGRASSSAHQQLSRLRSRNHLSSSLADSKSERLPRTSNRSSFDSNQSIYTVDKEVQKQKGSESSLRSAPHIPFNSVNSNDSCIYVESMFEESSAATTTIRNSNHSPENKKLSSRYRFNPFINRNQSIYKSSLPSEKLSSSKVNLETRSNSLFSSSVVPSSKNCDDDVIIVHEDEEFVSVEDTDNTANVAHGQEIPVNGVPDQFEETVEKRNDTPPAVANDREIKSGGSSCSGIFNYPNKIQNSFQSPLHFSIFGKINTTSSNNQHSSTTTTVKAGHSKEWNCLQQSPCLKKQTTYDNLAGNSLHNSKMREAKHSKAWNCFSSLQDFKMREAALAVKAKMALSNDLQKIELEKWNKKAINKSQSRLFEKIKRETYGISAYYRPGSSSSAVKRFKIEHFPPPFNCSDSSLKKENTVSETGEENTIFGDTVIFNEETIFTGNCGKFTYKDLQKSEYSKINSIFKSCIPYLLQSHHFEHFKC